MRKIHSVIELAKFKLNETVYWVTLRPIGPSYTEIPDNEADWILREHPKYLYSRGFDKSWISRAALPKLLDVDFRTITMLVTSKLVVEQFKIVCIERSADTGEFYYQNSDGERMPEAYLMSSKKMAIKERDRVMKMIATWASK